MDRHSIPNRLLASLPSKDRRRLLSRASEVALTAGEILCTPGARLLHAHFPIAGIISGQIPFGRRSSLQIELAGNEGMIGLPLVFGVSVAAMHRHVQFSGTSMRLTATVLRQELASSRALRSTLGKYAYVLGAQLAENVGCNSFHLLEARLARWLLATLDRADSSEFHLTHEQLGRMLGVRRESITIAASFLQKQQVLRYSRGDISILDRAGLETISCPCYRSSRNLYDRIFDR